MTFLRASHGDSRRAEAIPTHGRRLPYGISVVSRGGALLHAPAGRDPPGSAAAGTPISPTTCRSALRRDLCGPWQSAIAPRAAFRHCQKSGETAGRTGCLQIPNFHGISVPHTDRAGPALHKRSHPICKCRSNHTSRMVPTYPCDWGDPHGSAFCAYVFHGSPMQPPSSHNTRTSVSTGSAFHTPQIGHLRVSIEFTASTAGTVPHVCRHGHRLARDHAACLRKFPTGSVTQVCTETSVRLYSDLRIQPAHSNSLRRRGGHGYGIASTMRRRRLQGSWHVMVRPGAGPHSRPEGRFLRR